MIGIKVDMVAVVAVVDGEIDQILREEMIVVVNPLVKINSSNIKIIKITTALINVTKTKMVVTPTIIVQVEQIIVVTVTVVEIVTEEKKGDHIIIINIV